MLDSVVESAFWTMDVTKYEQEFDAAFWVQRAEKNDHREYAILTELRTLA